MFNLFFKVLIFVSLIININNGQSRNTPLDQFVTRVDPEYSWTNTGGVYTGETLAGKYNVHIINMTSQKWLNETYITGQGLIWWHWLLIVVPEKIDYHDFAVVIGTGNSNSATPPSQTEEYLRCAQYIATHAKVIAAVLYQIPNEPIKFNNDVLQKSRSEDAIIAFGWRQFLDWNPQDDFRYNWITHFPMTKAHVRAMDTVAAFAWSNQYMNVTRFAVAGASKRGWSTWLTAAVDERVVAFVPIVMDMPNFHPNLHHMYKAYGGWTWAFSDYYAENLTMDLDTEGFTELMEACDPYYFFDRYDGIQKLVIDATNDEFFMPDDEQFWWSDFPEPKYFEIVPDAEHSEATGVEVLVPSTSTFVTAYLQNISVPRIDWSIDSTSSGNITLTYTGNTSQILNVKRWHARSCSSGVYPPRRDWRVLSLDSPCHCGDTLDSGYCLNLVSLFTSIELEPISISDNTAVYTAGPPEYPEEYWIAFMISVEVQLFETDDPYMEGLFDGKTIKPDSVTNIITQYGRSVFTSQVSIVPIDYPYPNCNGTECYGTLV